MTITILTLRDRILSVRDRWEDQYKDWSDDRQFWDGKTAGESRRAIGALNLQTCSADDVAATINRGWVALECTECKQEFNTLCRIGDEPDYEARWVEVCASCLRKATRMLSKAS